MKNKNKQKKLETVDVEKFIRVKEKWEKAVDKLEERFPWLKDLDKGDTPDANYTNPDIEKFENFDIDLQQNLQKSDKEEDVEDEFGLVSPNKKRY